MSIDISDISLGTSGGATIGWLQVLVNLKANKIEAGRSIGGVLECPSRAEQHGIWQEILP